MAFEKEIKAALKNKYHKTMGLRDNAYESVANILGATPELTEDKIDDVVNGAEGYLKIIQGEADVARKTAKKQPTPPKADDPDPDPDPDDPDAKIAAMIAKANKPLLDEIEALKKGNASKANHEKLIAKLEEKKIAKEYYQPAIDGREFGSDEEIDAFVGKLETSYGTFNQSLADKGLSVVPKPILGGANDKGVSSGVQAYIDSKSGDDKKGSLGGKAI